MMKIDFDKWQEILISITRNKTRSFLTAFGIFWGIFMLVILLGGSDGVKKILTANFEGFATNSGFMGAQNTSKAYKGFKKGRAWDLVNKDVDIIHKRVNEIDVITPVIADWGNVATYNNNKVSCTTKGTYPEYYKIEAPDIIKGRGLNEIDNKERRKVCVIGKKIYESLFKTNENPCGKKIKVHGLYYTVVGVNVNTSNMSINGPTEQSVVIPFSTMQQNYYFGDKIHVLCYTAKGDNKITDVQKKVEKIIKKEHYISPKDKQAVLKINAEAMFSMLDELFKGINSLSWIVGLGTLLAGAIGVSNIMMVTVKERTIEIGIRRAIGARPVDILAQILYESVILTLIAGSLGIFFGVIVLQLIDIVNNSTGGSGYFQIKFFLAIGSLIVITILGLLAGLAPAYRAMSIKPVDAMRDE